ncbi:MAG: hypothetical protein ACTSWY_07795 [Promethearchaeota archaeon]
MDKKYMITPQIAKDWHTSKDKNGPTYSGSPSWKKYMKILENKLREYGVVDFVRNSWTYNKWYTTEWPNKENWGLVLGGKPIKVANYGAYSGSTDERGLTAELVYYDPWNPPESIEGKIVVFTPTTSDDPFDSSDYEYLSDPQTFPDFNVEPPITGVGPSRIPSISISVHIYSQMRQIWSRLVKILKDGNAAGALIVFNVSYDLLSGIYTFPVPPPYEAPTLFLDRIEGRKVIEDARMHKKATLKLIADVEPTETYQLICYLPGKNYGKSEDEMILLATHTDGPSLTQENGALGLLGIIYYFSQIPQSERSRTLMVFLDNRHYMPGMELRFTEQDYFERNQDAKKQIVSYVIMEHLGENEYREIENKPEPTGLVEPAALWVTNNKMLVKNAIQAVKENQWSRAIVTCVSRLGVHGKFQGRYYGLGTFWALRGIPGFACLGGLGIYWSIKTRINHFNANQFCNQVATMTELTSFLMGAKLNTIANEEYTDFNNDRSPVTGWPKSSKYA